MCTYSTNFFETLAETLRYNILEEADDRFTIELSDKTGLEPFYGGSFTTRADAVEHGEKLVECYVSYAIESWVELLAKPGCQ